MKILLGLLVLAFLAGCVGVHEVKGPDGKPALALKCGDATACYKKAGELCPDGYDLVSNNNASYVGGANGTFYGGSTTTILVECKAPGTAKN
jgi:hypothetical protein